MDAFDKSQIDDVLQALNRALGSEIQEATHEPREANPYRGGPYLQGGTHRRAWRVRWENLPPEIWRTLAGGALERIKAHPAELIVQWSDHLPFAVVVIRALPGISSWQVAQASERLLEALPGRLGPTNRSPRSESQLLICAKISEDRMQRIREAIKNRGQDEALRKDLAESLCHVGKASGTLRLESPAPNLLLVEGDGGWAILGKDEAHGPFRAFVFSKGNLGPHRNWEWDVPMWISFGLGTSDWRSFNFHPFLNGAIRHARHVGVEAGLLDESLSEASKMLPGNDPPASANKVPRGLHGELVTLHTRLQRLSTALHLSSTRSPVSSQDESGWTGGLHYEIQDDQGWPMMQAASATSDGLRASKIQAEEEARQVLDGLERRIDRALDLVTSVENRGLNRSMRFWAVLAAVLAALGIVVTARNDLGVAMSELLVQLGKRFAR